MANPAMAPCARAHEPSDLEVAIHLAQRMLTAYGSVDTGDIFDYAQAHGGLTEALRVLLRALDAERGGQQ